ncbi:hypothetical protein RCH17_003081, partial [Arthrobacter sp. MP_M7]|nr:hypothetical protein [Arthrobacter sp. MP_M4]MEC5204262.1 hypothetical protein [Arthrobacter sp. MP_M7]
MPLLNAANYLPQTKSPKGPGALSKAVSYLAAVIVVAAGLISGAVPANAATYTIKGVVTGKLTAAAAPSALGSVWVGAYSNDSQSSYVAGAWSAADGTYSFTVPAAGKYKIWTTCASGACSSTYPDEWYNNHPSSYGSDAVAISDTAPTVTINPQLDGFGKMSGRITNAAGAAVAAVEISASTNGGQVSSTTPDANGYYTLTKVPPNLTNISVRDSSGRSLYKGQSWNGTQGTETYTATTVPAGVNWTNANFKLNSETVLEATITDTSGTPLAEIGYTPYVFNDATGIWDGPQMGPLLSDGSGKVYWPITAGKKYKLCVTDDYYYRGAPRKYRYKPECYNNAATMETASVLTATTAGQRVQVPMKLDVAGLSLTAGEIFAYGSAQAGQRLTVDPGTWGPAPVTLSYQWQRVKASVLADIVGATSSTYSPTAADAGYDIWAKVTGMKAGYATHSESVYAGESGAAAITASKPLTLVGSPRAGSTLTADFGTLTPAPQYGPSYNWYVDGVADYRSYGATFALQPSAAGRKVTVRVSAHEGPREPYYGQASATVAAGTLTAPVPTITGTAKVSQKLTANPGVWGPAPVTLGYQWFRSGVAITGATAAAYTAVSEDLAKTLTVRVTGSKAGFTSAAKSSAATAAVA